MERQKIHIIKIGGNVIDDKSTLEQFIDDFSQISGYKILVHGGGKLASELCEQMGIEVKMVDGRRITDADTMKVVTKVYAGLINKNIVAELQSRGCNAAGLTGADMNLIPAHKRSHPEIDFGYVGDFEVSAINTSILKVLLDNGITPVFCAITHDQKGNLLNTNADTIASGLAIALSGIYLTDLIYCFDKKGVLADVENDNSLIEAIDQMEYSKLRKNHKIHSGMIPKLDNAFHAISRGVHGIYIKHASDLLTTAGTQLTQ